MKTLVKFGPLEAEATPALLVLCSSQPATRDTQLANLPPASPYAETVLAFVQRGDFRGKFLETAWLYPQGLPAQRLLLAGMHLPEEEKRHYGEGPHLQYVIAAAVAAARKLGVTELCLPLGGRVRRLLGERGAAQLAGEAAMLPSYQFNTYKKATEEKDRRLAALTLLGESAEAKAKIEAGTRLGAIAGEWTCFARDLQNLPPNDLTPEIFAHLAQEQAEAANLSCQVLDEKEMRALGMGALLGVAQGSAQPPRFVVLENRPKAEAETLVLVGKGVTFDSGGISLKPPEAMEEMKTDMSGAAVVLASMCALARLDTALHVVGLLPLVENMPSGTAQRPGDVVRAANGTTIEVADTDAEGRLILADALLYAARFKPAAIIDLATLTGTIFYVLGESAAGLFSNDQALAARIEQAAATTGERVWRLPLFPEFRKHLDSDIADIRNVSAERTGAGASKAAAFLSEFVKGCKWAHLDIAAVATPRKGNALVPKGSSGWGVRLLLQLCRSWTKPHAKAGIKSAEN